MRDVRETNRYEENTGLGVGKSNLEECIMIRSEQGDCAVGEAVVTTGGNLKSRLVVHTAVSV